MNRRHAIACIASVLAPGTGWAQSTQPLRVGWLATGQRSGFDQFFVSFRDGLAALGYVRGGNLVLEDRWGETLEISERLAAELVALKPTVIVTAAAAVRAVAKTAASIPVVFGFSGNPVDAGLSSNFAHPDRNMTGMSFMQLDLVGKRIEIMKEVLPGMRRLAVLSNQQHAGEPREYAVTREAADRLGVSISYHPFNGAPDVDQALAAALQARAEAGVVFPDGSMMAIRGKFAEFSLRHRIPLVSGWAAFADGGNLLSYGPNLLTSWRRLASYVDRIAKGARPADLPIEFPTTVEMIVNARVAKALGLKIPQAVLLRADRVIA